MHNNLCKLILAGLVCGCSGYLKANDETSQYIRPSQSPTALHRKMIARKYGMFIHFGINTFHDMEWTDGTKPASSYAPTAVDTDNWARTATDAGMKYVILISKHHDGFCLWDSKHTEYDVAASPNKTDVIAAMAKSCRKYGIELGLYYSLWDRHWGDGVMRRSTFKADLKLTREQKQAYVDYMEKQLTELLSNYGEICELWLDGGWVMPREAWQIPRIYSHVKKLQPACAIGVNWSIGRPGKPDSSLVKPNEQKEGFPIRYFPSDFRLGDPYLPAKPDPKLFSHDGNLYYMPFESTICLNDKWFFNTKDNALKSVDELARLYKTATDQDNILIFNSPPNRHGVMPERNVTRLKELAEHLGLTGDNKISEPITEGDGLTRSIHEAAS